MPTRKACDRTEVQIVHVRLFKLNLLWQRHKRGVTGNRLCLGSRHWLKPGAYLWEVGVRKFDKETGKEVHCRVSRSAWRRPVPALDKPPCSGAWEYQAKRKRKVKKQVENHRFI